MCSKCRDLYNTRNKFTLKQRPSCRHDTHTRLHRLSFLLTNRGACIGSVCPCKNPIRAIMLFSQKDIVFEKPHSQTRHFICPYNFSLSKLTSVMSFYTPAEGGETADIDTCPMNFVPAERIC